MPKCTNCKQSKPLEYGRWFPGKDNRGFYTIKQASWGCSICNEETIKQVIGDLIHA